MKKNPSVLNNNNSINNSGTMHIKISDTYINIHICSLLANQSIKYHNIINITYTTEFTLLRNYSQIHSVIPRHVLTQTQLQLYN